ncbi:MAG: hypothetical protein CVT67_07955 [Actinobacteria bacterium HGW-Actinobacteria-7]|jgi:hypothetical protein|nr:MAG: hypothetical protein CVT67_07955 [Actinobacteria bacterium HGW-Actinobacteria-7]
MTETKRLDRRALWVVLALVDLVAVGAGMGVPLFAILWGFPVGWWLARSRGLHEALGGGALLAGLTAAVMLALWGPQLRFLADPGFDAKAWGIPLVLYTSRASFIGWEILMMVISPVLQFMASATAAALTVLPNAEPRTTR